MLAYIATYPRSGNALVQRLVAACFWRLPGEVKIQPRAALPPKGLEGWELRRPSSGEPRPDIPGGLGEWLIACRRAVEGEPERWALRAAPRGLLTRDARRALAAHEEVFLLKTHHPPFEDFLPGERAVQVLRHPGPSIRSYHRLLQAQAQKAGRADAPGLDEVIEGEVQFGSWSAYNRAWAEARARLGPRALALRFEELVRDQDGAREALAAFLGLPVRAEARIDFGAYAGKHAAAAVRGRDDGYEAAYTPAQLRRLWSLHGPVAESLGFSPPDLARAA